MAGKRVTHEDEFFLRDASSHDREALVNVGGFTPQRGNAAGSYTTGRLNTQTLADHGDTLIDSIHSAIDTLPHSKQKSAARRHMYTAQAFHRDAVSTGDSEASTTAHRYMFNAINSMTHFVKENPTHKVSAFLPFLHKDLKEYKNVARSIQE
jgi:hypothetical protein